ncbi:MAG: T9SS type A sorting domain-containing protein [Bacteroidetes bacterium]|nr:T9SS type A sorting domain-containing protein [Bacteroidota bacterium]
MHIVPYSTYFYIALQYPNSNSSTFTLGSNYGYTFTAPGLINCGFNFGVNTSLAQVSGNIFADENSNGIREGSEQRLPYELVKVGNYFTTTNSIGNYSINVPVGYYSITKPSTGLYAGKPILPTQLTVNATTPGALYNNNNFGIGIPATYKDIAIDVIPTSTISATRLATYQVQISNLANNLAYYQADILNDSVLDYFFAHYPNIDNYNANNDVATWYGHLIRFQRRIIPIGYTVSASATINQALLNVGSVALQLDTDQNLSNDTARTQQVVISSYDPNNKVPGNCGETERGYILAGDKMQYTINFQNTGNDVAVNIVLKDVISPNLDINSLRFIATSHVNNFSLRVDGDTVYFIYKSIMLPDSLSNESASKGWVSFSIQQKPNLTVGSEIKNTAAIYFDYNEAVITNTTLHTIASYLSISEAYEDVKLNIYPNPTNDKVMVEVPSNMFGTKMHVTDMLGRHILSKEVDTPTETVSVSDLPSGIYIVSLDGNGRLLQSKLVIE